MKICAFLIPSVISFFSLACASTGPSDTLLAKENVSKADTGMQVSGSPLFLTDSIPAKGWQVYLRLNAGSVLEGPQKETGLVSDNGDTASTGKAGFYLGMRYFFLPYMGLELETGGMFSSANAKNTKSMSLYNAWSSNLGLVLVPWQRVTLAGRWQALVSGGVGFTRLSVADDFKDFLFQNASIQIVDDAATGMGWHAGGGVRLITRLGLLADIGLRYSKEYPKFPEGTRAFRASSLLFDLGLGYQF